MDVSAGTIGGAMPVRFDREMEQEQLELADLHLAGGVQRVSAQRLLLERLEAKGWNTGQARLLLSIMVEILDTMQAHRAQIIEILDVHDSWAKSGVHLSPASHLS